MLGVGGSIEGQPFEGELEDLEPSVGLSSGLWNTGVEESSNIPVDYKEYTVL